MVFFLSSKSDFEEVMLMSWNDFLLFCTLIVAVIALVVDISNKDAKRK